MTVQAQDSVQYYDGPINVGAVIPITDFTFIDNSHVSLKIRGIDEIWEYGTDYTVEGADTLTRTITLNRAVEAGQVLAAYLDVPITQNISPEEGGNFPASTNEFVLDKLTCICQMLYERITRSLQVSIDSNFDGTLYGASDNIGKAFIVNDAGTGVAFTTYSMADLEYIARRLYQSIDNVDIVADDIASVITDATNIASINTVATDISSVNTTANSITNVNIVGDDLALGVNSAINKVNANKANIDIDAAAIENINTTANSITNVNIVGDDLALDVSSKISRVSASKENVDTTAESIDNVNTTANSITNVNIVGDDLALGVNSAINKVNANKANIDINAVNITAIQDAYQNAQTASLGAITATNQANTSHIWADGTDEEVQALGGVHSSKGWAEESAKGQVQSDFTENDSSQKSYIRNKPNLNDGYFPNLKVGLADNLYDASVPISIGTFALRTTAGNESISSGAAILNSVHGAIHTTDYTPRSGNATATEDINLTNFNLDQFELNQLPTGTYLFEYDNGDWTLEDTSVDIEDYGLFASPRAQSLDIVSTSQSLTVACTNIDTFATKIGGVTGYYQFDYLDYDIDSDNPDPATHVGPYWAREGVEVDLTEYAISVVGTPVNGDSIQIQYVSALKTGSITVQYVKESYGDITVATPRVLKATTSMNQYDKNDPSKVIQDATIDSSGQIVAEVGSKVCLVRAAGGVYSGYVAYSEGNYITKIGYSETMPQLGDTLVLTGTTQDPELSVILFDNNGWVAVAVTDNSDLSVHPRWSSGQDQDHTYDAYGVSKITLPTVDIDGNTLPWVTDGLAAIDTVFDELNFDQKRYIRRIGKLANTPENMATVQAYGTLYIYDSYHIYYVLKDTDIQTYDLAANVAREFTVNDYGTEYYLGIDSAEQEIPLQTNISYGNNLKDKLRTDVLTISAQSLTDAQKAQVRANHNTVNKSGDTMTGTLTNTEGFIIQRNNTTEFLGKNTGYDYTTSKAPASIITVGQVRFLDKNGKLSGTYQNYFDTNNRLVTQIYARRSIGGTEKSAALAVGVDSAGKRYYNPVQLITTHVSGNSGYNIWSNGYCEQWGYTAIKQDTATTITLAKKMANANYNALLVSAVKTDNSNNNGKSITALAANSFTVFDHDYGGNVRWRVFGYLAADQY